MENLSEILLENKAMYLLIVAGFLYLIFGKYLHKLSPFSKIKFRIPLKARTKIFSQDIKGLENLSPEKAAIAKEKLKKITELQSGVLGKIVFQIRRENPGISQEELVKRAVSEYNREKLKHPELRYTNLKNLKILKTEPPSEK